MLADRAPTFRPDGAILRRSEALPAKPTRVCCVSLVMGVRSRIPGLLLFVLVVGAAVAACRQNDAPEAATALWDRVHAASFRTWRRAPGYEQRRSSNAPHSNDVDIYVNPTLAAALDAQRPLTAWPEGSLIVKEGFDGNEREIVAMMEKRADGWFWAEYDDDGEPLYSGKPDICTDCHASGADSVRAFGFPK